jgi:hypothetical protein
VLSNVALQWILTVVFAATGGYFLVRVFVGFNAVDRIVDLAHVIMSVVMVSMPWPWGMSIPVALQITVFTLAACWFVYLALFRPRTNIGPIEGHHQRPLLLWYHAIMMGSMVVMAALMSLALPMSSGDEMGDMSMQAMSMPSPTAASNGMSTPVWAAIVSLLFAVFAVTFLVWLLRSRLHPPREHPTALALDESARIVMAAGMTIAFVALL